MCPQIGGYTYHSKIPIPRTNIDRASIRIPTSMPRYTQLITTFDGVKYVIIDEMSMGVCHIECHAVHTQRSHCPR